MAGSIRELRASRQQPQKDEEKHYCRECSLLQIDYTNLSVKEKKPIMGYCPVKGFCVLLSFEACDKLSLVR